MGQTSLEIDSSRQQDEELWASYVDEWLTRANLSHWREWTSWLLGPDPRIGREMAESLLSLSDWLLSRIWPAIHPGIRSSLINFRAVLNDLLLTFHEHSELQSEMYVTERFYKVRLVEEHVYRELLDRYERHVHLVHDLTLELTRAANYVCDNVRSELLRSFRLGEGALIVDRGPNMSLKTEIIRTEYRPPHRTGIPYPGLEKFKSIRFQRDFFVSERD